jgi:hypothetical protein
VCAVATNNLCRTVASIIFYQTDLVQCTIGQCHALFHLCIPYSGKFSWSPISTDGQSSKFSQFNFRQHYNHGHSTLYNRTHFTGLNFTDSHLSVQTARIRPHKNFPLYGSVVRSRKLPSQMKVYTGHTVLSANYPSPLTFMHVPLLLSTNT